MKLRGNLTIYFNNNMSTALAFLDIELAFEKT
jgi:hypothetical protein